MYLPRHPQIALFLQQLTQAAAQEEPAELRCPLCGQPLELQSSEERLAALCPDCRFHAAVSRPFPSPALEKEQRKSSH